MAFIVSSNNLLSQDEYRQFPNKACLLRKFVEVGSHGEVFGISVFLQKLLEVTILVVFPFLFYEVVSISEFHDLEHLVYGLVFVL